jgi:hypothetical protein
LPDAVQKELSSILTDLNVIEYAHENMIRLLNQMMAELPRTSDSTEERKRKDTQIDLSKIHSSFIKTDAQRSCNC